MAKKSSSHREFSIPGDELEQHRIQLEHNLQNTDLSLHLSSLPDDDADADESLEYPRHNSAPENPPVFASFDRYSNENMDLDASHVRAWSIHDDEGITPHDVRTMSTAAHHASAVTITAGLGRGGRREPSFSGAEYDPERPLQDIIAACHTGSDEADRSQDISRPKLSETLQRVGFSPRRPRSGQSRAPQHVAYAIPEPTQRTTDTNVPRRNPTPRVRKTTVSFDTTATPNRRHAIQPHVNVQPPTPSTSGSRFTKMARGLTRDVREAQEQWREDNAPISSTDLNHENRAAKKSNRSRLQLPDVTGLTNAVVSPAKANLERYSVRGGSSKEVEARLVASLNTLHIRLNDLETENSIARRRVRELEYELEECKRDVVRERTRVMESQDISAARIAAPSTSRTKGKERRYKEADPTSKYLEVVQEKKALEALITTLRSHLSRVTSDLSSQHQLLEELRALRESDALSLAEKAQEINQLRTEVERLAGEIEVLRGVVEEGLHERRQGRETVGRFIDDEEIDRISVDLDERRSERASNSSVQSSHSASFHREEATSSPLPIQDPDGKPTDAVESNPPFPKISSERMERLFFSAPRHNAAACRMCRGHRLCAAAASHQEDKDEGFEEGIEPRPQPDHPCEIGRRTEHRYTLEEILERMDRNGGSLRLGDIPPQTVLARVVGELEDEFAHFKGVYSGLSEEYRSLDCATQAEKRHAVGDRLRDVIEVLERKGNQIASLYDLLAFKDKPFEC